MADDQVLRAHMGRALQIARQTAGLTQEALAVRLGTSQPTIARLERGGRWPSSRTVADVLRLTGAGDLGQLLARAQAELRAAS